MKRSALAAVALAGISLAPWPVAAEPPPEEERPLDAIPIPAEKSGTPKPAEWVAAPRVRVTRRGPGAAGCRAYLLREWLRVRCAGEAFALSLLGGEADVAFWIDPASKEGEALFPLRRGGKHVIQIWKAGKDASGAFVPVPLVVIQQHWTRDAPLPIITLF